MNKAELVAAMAAKTGLTKKDTEATLAAFVETVEKELKKKDGKVQLIGFGTFEIRSRKARTGRNPQKPGEVVKIPASKAPVFKAGKAFKDVSTRSNLTSASVINRREAFGSLFFLPEGQSLLDERLFFGVIFLYTCCERF